MNPTQRQARRSSIRADVAGQEIKGVIDRQDHAMRVPFILWDVSEDGLGIWSAADFAAGSLVKMIFPKPFGLVIAAEIVWCRPSDGKPGFDCGLRVAAGPGQSSLAALLKMVTAKSP